MEANERVEMIVEWMEAHNVERHRYEINEDGTIDGDKIDLSDYDIEELPKFISFRHVSFFWINRNPRLRSKRGFPESGMFINYDGGLIED